jgi:hypothetical protein
MSIIVCPILVDRTLDVSIWWVHLTASVSQVVPEMAELDANVLLLKLTAANLRSVVPMLNVDLTKKESVNASAHRTFPMEIPIKVVHHHLETNNVKRIPTAQLTNHAFVAIVKILAH